MGGQVSAWQAEGPDGHIYLISHDRALHSLDPVTGQDLWRYRPGGNLIDFLAVSPDGTIYIQNDRGEIDAVNPEGQARWRCSLGGNSTLQPLVSPEGTLFLVMVDGTMAAISRHGVLLWQKELSGTPGASPVMNMMGTIALPLQEGGVMLLDQEGQLIQILQSDKIDQLILDLQDNLYGITIKGKLFCWNNQGELLWNSGTEPGEYSSLFLRKDSVFMMLKSGLLYRVNQQGADSFYQAPPPEHPAMVLHNEEILMVGQDQLLWIINPETQEQRSMPLNSPVVLPLLTSRGTLMLGGADWKIYAYDVGLPREGWSQYRGNSSRNGSLYSVISARSREEYYKNDPRYNYYNRLFQLGEREDQQQIIEAVMRYDSWAELNSQIPFWDLMMLKVAGEGVNRLVFQDGRRVSSDPLLRMKAYEILGQWELFSARDQVIETLRAEDNPMVLAQGYLTLGQIGGDWDGRSLAMIRHSLRSKGQPQPAQIISAAQAYLMLLKWGGEAQSLRIMGAYGELSAYTSAAEVRGQLDQMLDDYFREE